MRYGTHCSQPPRNLAWLVLFLCAIAAGAANVEVYHAAEFNTIFTTDVEGTTTIDLHKIHEIEPVALPELGPAQT